MEQGFDAGRAFSRNIGWLSKSEQESLAKRRIAIAGLGGVGGAHLTTLARLGIGAFKLADFDAFEVHNFNRQAGAFVSTLGQAKSAVLTRLANDINPDAVVDVFADGVNEDNVDRFLEGVDVYVDGIDFFAMDARRLIFDACHRKGIPALTAAPLGMGVAFLMFDPKGMSFEEYFRLDGVSEIEQYARFIAGLSPAMLQRTYLQDDAAVSFRERRGPSTIMACDLCAGVMGTEVLKVLLNRGPVRAAPWGLQFDAYRQRFVRTWRPFGNANPLQKLLIAMIRPRLGM